MNKGVCRLLIGLKNIVAVDGGQPFRVERKNLRDDDSDVEALR